MRCRSCLIEKPAEGFYASNKTRCKECVKTSVHANRMDRIDYYRQYDRMRSAMPHRKANNFQQSQSWRQEYPNRRRAQGLVQHALRAGRLQRQPCWICGAKAVAHHPDYDRPLDVVWLCQPHHKQAHAIVANEPTQQTA